ncbi:C1 family peptidase [uncultured Methanobrevibacter sp.]|uniref:C1 family peptidase n=1 Tax=uncultured Methanobrevibacter sp. TaxID=253161 RepID=UPI00260A57FA|nr:C1 family peptidase [uncultured Methanobrevibacter sp.]
MNVFKIAIVMLILILSIGAVCAADDLSEDAIYDGDQKILESTQKDINTTDEGSFTDLNREITNATDIMDITRDYKFNNETDTPVRGIIVNKNNFVINGNGHTLDGNGQTRLMTLTGVNITINNLRLINGNADQGGAIFIYSDSSITTNNMTFENNSANKMGGAVSVEGNYTSVNDKFINNQGIGAAIASTTGSTSVTLNNGTFISDDNLSWGLIYLRNCLMSIENTTFANIYSNYSSAVYAESSRGKIRNCIFTNMTAAMTAGALGIKSIDDEITIENCSFINDFAGRNGGAIYADVAGSDGEGNGNITIINSRFINCISEFGGGYLQLGGNLNVDGSLFDSNGAYFNGGAIYTSWTCAAISNSNFTSNGIAVYDGYPTYGGACYFDSTFITIDSCIFKNNTGNGSSIGSYDCNLNITNSYFNNPGINCSSIYGVFTVLIQSANNFTDDVVSMNNTNYDYNGENTQSTLVLINNTITVENLPARFDLRDWGWVSSVKNQGNMGGCWAFGTTGALESTLIRYANITSDFSENNLQNSMLRYSKYGFKNSSEGGNAKLAMGYYISWMGAFPDQFEAFDQLGKISPLIATPNDVHILNIVLVSPRNNSTDNDRHKWAILKYGSMEVNYYHTFDPMFFNSSTNAYYYNGTGHNHAISLVGWDDNYPKENFAMTPEGNGAWIVKNSWGTDWGENGFFYISYYDKSFMTEDPAMAFIIENIDYDAIYQHETCYEDDTNYTYYKNSFASEHDTLIEAVGTYFGCENAEYEFSILVNGKAVHHQSSTSDFMGYECIKMDKYIKINKGDVFEVVFKNSANAVGSVRFDTQPNVSFASYDGVKWTDLTEEYTAAILKAYVRSEDAKITNNKDISVDYAGGSFFSVNVATADGHAVVGDVVKFTINGKTTEVPTDDKGIAKIKITDVPGKYTIKTSYDGKTYSNKVTVKQVLTTSKITVKKTAKSFKLQAKLKINGKLVKGKKITFKFNGKTYKATTNSKGIAKVTIKKNVIKKLKKGKTYTFKVTYLKDTIKSTVKVTR